MDNFWFIALHTTIINPSMSRSIIKIIQEVRVAVRSGAVENIGDLAQMLSNRGVALVLLILSIPMALPIPVPPGVNIALAAPLLFITAQQVLGINNLWLPKKLERIKISSWLNKVLGAALPYLKKAHKLLDPRFEKITSRLGVRFIGIAGFMMALVVCVPVPGSNTVPSLGIAVMALGTLTRDGVAVILGAIIGIAWISALAAAAIFGVHFINDLM